MIPYLDEEDPMDKVLALADPPDPNAEALRSVAGEWQGAQPDVQPAEMDVLNKVMQNLAPSPRPSVAQAPMQPKQESMSDLGAGGRKRRGIDPGLAFMAAFSQNPMLMRMVQDQQEEPYRRAKEQREAEKWGLERDLMAPLRAGKLQNDNALSASKLDDTKPGTPYANAMRQAALSQLQVMQSNATRANSPIAKELEGVSRIIASDQNLSPAQIQNLLKPFGKLANDVVAQAQKQASLTETSRHNRTQEQHWTTQDQNALARINATRQRAMAPRVGAREHAAQIKNQEKLDDEIEKAEWARNILTRVADLKHSVNTGPLAGRWQELLQEVDASSPEFNELKQNLTMVSNRIIKELSGSAVTGNEWARMQGELANIMNDDRNFMQKLAAMIDLTESIKQRAINRYARMEGGETADRTNTAARVTAGKPQTRAGETPPPDATPGADNPPVKPGSAVGQKKRNTKTGTTWTWDGAKWGK